MMSVYLTQEQTDALKALSVITRVPTAVRIRDAVDLVIKCARDDGMLPEADDGGDVQ